MVSSVKKIMYQCEDKLIYLEIEPFILMGMIGEK